LEDIFEESCEESFREIFEEYQFNKFHIIEIFHFSTSSLLSRRGVTLKITNT